MPYNSYSWTNAAVDVAAHNRAFRRLEDAFKVSENLVKHNAKVKIFPDGGTEIIYSKSPIFRDKSSLHRDDDVIEEIELKPKREKTNRVRINEIIKRNRDRIRDIILCNDFKYFLTITLDKEVIDRYDVDNFKKKLHNWLHNNVIRKDLKYILIPEYHKDGALHCHALINGVFDMVYSGKRTKEGKAIFNIPDWKYGFTTAIRLDNNKIRVGNYVMKYITKGSDKIFGKYFWSSKNIQREPQVYLFDADYDAVDAKEYKPLANCDTVGFKYECNLIERYSAPSRPIVFVNSRGEEIEVAGASACVDAMQADMKGSEMQWSATGSSAATSPNVGHALPVM